jgi:hypothetical protein
MLQLKLSIDTLQLLNILHQLTVLRYGTMIWRSRTSNLAKPCVLLFKNFASIYLCITHLW